MSPSGTAVSGGDNERICIDDNRPRSVDTARCRCNRLRKIDEVPVKRHYTNIVVFMELFVNEGDGRDPSGRVVKFARGGTRCFCLQMQKARHNLQAILDPMIDLLQQQILLSPALLESTFCIFKIAPLIRSRSDSSSSNNRSPSHNGLLQCPLPACGRVLRARAIAPSRHLQWRVPDASRSNSEPTG